MTVLPPTPDDTIEQRIQRLMDGYFNSGDQTPANPGGLGDDGHTENLPTLLVDVAAVAQHVGANAATTVVLAQDWATKTDGPVAGAEWSAKHHAGQAAERATAAAGSAGSAASSAAAAAAAIANTNGLWCGIATGSPTAIILTPSVPLGAYAAGVTLRFMAASVATGGTTVNVSGLGARQIKYMAGAAIAAGAWAAGDVVEVTYTGTEFRLAGAAPAAAQIAAAPILGGGQVDAASDYIPIVDATDGALKRVAPANLGVSGGWTVTDKVASFAVGTADTGRAYRCKASLTVSVADAASLPLTWTVRVQALAGPVTIAPAAGQSIDGASALTIAAGEWVEVCRLADGTGLCSFIVPTSPSIMSMMTWSNTYKAAAVTLSNGGRTATMPGGAELGIQGTTEITGRKYCIVQAGPGTYAANNTHVGITLARGMAMDPGWFNGAGTIRTYRPEGQIWYGNHQYYTDAAPWGALDYITVAVDTALGYIWFAKNNSFQRGGNPVNNSNPSATFTAGSPVYALFNSTQNRSMTLISDSPYGPIPGFAPL